MRAGRLRHKVTITEPTVTGQDSYGQDVITPTTVGYFWCNVEYMDGRELQTAMQRWAKARYKITMRRQPGIDFAPIMTVTWNGRDLDILDVQDPGESMRPEVILYAQDHEG